MHAIHQIYRLNLRNQKTIWRMESMFLTLIILTLKNYLKKMSFFVMMLIRLLIQKNSLSSVPVNEKDNSPTVKHQMIKSLQSIFQNLMHIIKLVMILTNKSVLQPTTSMFHHITFKNKLIITGILSLAFYEKKR